MKFCRSKFQNFFVLLQPNKKLYIYVKGSFYFYNFKIIFLRLLDISNLSLIYEFFALLYVFKDIIFVLKTCSSHYLFISKS